MQRLAAITATNRLALSWGSQRSRRMLQREPCGADADADAGAAR